MVRMRFFPSCMWHVTHGVEPITCSLSQMILNYVKNTYLKGRKAVREAASCIANAENAGLQLSRIFCILKIMARSNSALCLVRVHSNFILYQILFECVNDTGFFRDVIEWNVPIQLHVIGQSGEMKMSWSRIKVQGRSWQLRSISALDPETHVVRG